MANNLLPLNMQLKKLDLLLKETIPMPVCEHLYLSKEVYGFPLFIVLFLFETVCHSLCCPVKQNYQKLYKTVKFTMSMSHINFKAE